MSLDRSEVENIAMLARLKIEEQDVPHYVDALSSILDLVDEMQAIDTQGVTPLANPLDSVQRLRADEVTEDNQREHFQSIAPATDAGLYLVPKVIE
ncbi:Asp-tRNA(Asn)/Glu-tRNA(Gln) amidotransferase subunit GatC [Natronospirillum operosum]|uniref:Aspartyl/glutamyl-tRNA(Asn/Gln) amidotransferase subunit C n=1 Tax=Natronospirillum operosum TaxID=2759953 RepID=A0A4Z0WJE6_9GAMM|nr:Asp-tRNA(Asn)/Glu-tRNA(Gln) amidotransferase subunit GatC [Natronospirillum operosum]TGG95305.1 Asp-tRNA(Asn)/Glu-tRNA(Gln) amidotransferase subunit GatC [Natronospirillum operosum]